MSSHVIWSPIAPAFMAILCRQQGVKAAIGIICDNGHVADAGKQRERRHHQPCCHIDAFLALMPSLT
jgi:hypothetical protein